MMSYDFEDVKRLFDTGDEEIYVILEELDDHEIEAMIEDAQKHDLAGTYEMCQFLWAYLDVRKE